MADVSLWRWASSAVAQRRQEVAQSLHEKVFAWLTMADPRDLQQTWVAGRCLYGAQGAESAGTKLPHN
jgi:guanine deaminase